MDTMVGILGPFHNRITTGSPELYQQSDSKVLTLNNSHTHDINKHRIGIVTIFLTSGKRGIRKDLLGDKTI